MSLGQRRSWKTFALVALVAACPQPLQALEGLSLPERRKAQFVTDFGYGVIPFPYRLPGLGSGLSLLGGAMNIADTHTDVYGAIFGGDISGRALSVGDIHVLPRNLIVDVGMSALSRASIQSYAQRGMRGDKNDYRLVELGDTEYLGARATATFFDRRIEFYAAKYAGSAQLRSIRDRDGTLIVEAQNAPRERGTVTILGSRIDLTDDYADPRRGVRADISGTWSPPRGRGADAYVIDANFAAYVPFGARNTWVFNLLRSDAHVVRPGETDPVALQVAQGLNCAAIVDPTQRAWCDQVINDMVAQNRYGTATSLGGFNRLRAYSQSRFRGAHTAFFGTEFRWNITEERAPFDIFIMRDVRTVLQLAVFYETGATSDVIGDLSDRGSYRSNAGVGLRIVTASGVVFRADIARGADGMGVAMFIGYPWEI